MTPIIGFAPDLDPTTPGVLTDCTDLIPSLRGMKGAPSSVTTTLAALAAECRGSAVVTKLDGSRRLFAGSTTKLYEASGTSWTDQTRTVGGNYTLGGDSRWRFAQFGNVTIAGSGTDTIQASTSGAFSDIAGAPKARYVETAANFVLAFATNDGTYGDRPHGWWCSGLADQTTWTPSAATQAANGVLIATPGEIRGARALGDQVVVYKERSMYLGSYIGPPIIWAWPRISGDVGALSQESIVNIGPAHLFLGAEDFWIYDGSRPISIADKQVREWFMNNSDPSLRYKTQAMYDRINGLVYWFFIPNGQTTLQKGLVFNIKTGKWGRIDRTVEALVEYVASAFTYDTGPTTYTYDSGPAVSYDSPFWFSAASVPAIFNTSHQIATLTGVAGSCSFTGWDQGDDNQFSTMTEIRARFLSKPTTASLTPYYKYNEGESLTAGSPISIRDQTFDVLQSARWHRWKIDTTGDFEVTAIRPIAVPDGLQ